jgi:hypothetical protein
VKNAYIKSNEKGGGNEELLLSFLVHFLNESLDLLLLLVDYSYKRRIHTHT